MKACPYCAEAILEAAIKCRYCGSDLRVPPGTPATPAAAPVERLWSPGVAAVLSFILPGLGQIYKGQIVNGLVWLVLVVATYLLFLPLGLLLHLACLAGEASGNPYNYKPSIGNLPDAPGLRRRS